MIEKVVPRAYGDGGGFKVVVLGKELTIKERLVSVWNEVITPNESDAKRISELSRLIPGEENHLTAAHIRKVILGEQARIGYPQHIRVYKAGGVVQGYTLAEVNDKTGVVNILQTAVDEEFRFGVGFCLRTKLVQELEQAGHSRFFAFPNEASSPQIEGLGFKPESFEMEPGHPQTFLVFGMSAREVLYENTRRKLVRDLTGESVEEKKLARNMVGEWAEYNRYFLDESSYAPILKPLLGDAVHHLPPEELASRINDDVLVPAMLNPETRDRVRWSEVFGEREKPLPAGFNPIDDLADNMARYQIEGFDFRSEVFEKLKAGDLRPLRRYVWLRSKVYGQKDST